MAINNFQDLLSTYDDGNISYSTWRKSPTQATTIGIWFDLSSSPGNPSPQYYAATPLAASPLSYSNDGGILHGRAADPLVKYLRTITAVTTVATALPMPMMLLDYLMFYPFIDEGDSNSTLININTLPRYTDGAGVQIMPVVVGAHSLASGVRFNLTYTNSDGIQNRTSNTVELTTAQSLNGTIATSARATQFCNSPFIPLQSGDTGVRSIESVTFLTGDVGLISLVLVKPLAQMLLIGIDAPVEKDYFINHGNQLPIIKNDAYLNFICCPAGSLAATAIHGDITVCWR